MALLDVIASGDYDAAAALIIVHLAVDVAVAESVVLVDVAAAGVYLFDAFD